MGGDETHTLCPYCYRRVDPEEPGVIYAVEQVEMLTMGPTRTNLTAWRVFGPECSPRRSAGFAASVQARLILEQTCNGEVGKGGKRRARRAR